MVPSIIAAASLPYSADLPHYGANIYNVPTWHNYSRDYMLQHNPGQ
jgi:hypothetical protein